MKKIFFIILIILLLGIIFVWQGIYLPKSVFGGKTITLAVEKGVGAKEIAHNLQKEGIIKWAPLLRVYVYIKGIAGNLRAGEYQLSSTMNIPKIVGKFVSGEVIKKQITIIEGWNLEDVGSYLEKEGILQKEEFLELANKDFSQEFDFLKDKPKNLGLEGYLFPDTYEIIKDESTEEIIIKMLKNFDKKIAPYRDEISGAGLTIFDAITMASILEKEVKTYEDKEIVSGIFWKRIEEKLPLQSCATIAYIKGENQWQYSYEDTRIESPYNTYLNLGLPLGPISNPGIDSIKAAIFPKDTEYNYFLTDPETEKTIFSETYEEHNTNKSKYLK
jgi:UPF0755 protein